MSEHGGYSVQSADGTEIHRADRPEDLRGIARLYAARGWEGAHPIYHRGRRCGRVLVMGRRWTIEGTEPEGGEM